MLFPDSINTEDLAELLTIKTSSELSLEQKERAIDEWTKTLWARKKEEKKQKRSKHRIQKIYWWM